MIIGSIVAYCIMTAAMFLVIHEDYMDAKDLALTAAVAIFWPIPLAAGLLNKMVR